MSLEVVYSDPGEMIAWARQRIYGGDFRSDAQAIGLASSGELIAVTVFDTFGPNDCLMSVAADYTRPWLTRSYMRHVAAYPFITCGLRRISTLVSERNERSRRFNEHMGLKLEGVKRQAGVDGEDLLMFGLLRSDCRWIPKTFYRPRKSSGLEL